MSERVALVTGCSSGIGSATAELFSDSGWMVYATARDSDHLTNLSGDECITATVDVTKTEETTAIIEKIERDQGRLDCLVNNAGFGQLGPVEEIPPNAMQEQFDVNVFGPHRLIQAGLPLLRKGGSGTIVNVSSVYGQITMPGQGAYSSSKFALEALSETLRTELSGSGINVTVIEPGPVETNFGKTALKTKQNLISSGAHGWFHWAYQTRRLIDKAPGFVQPESVAATIQEAAEDDQPQSRYVVGPYKFVLPFAELIPTKFRDRGFSFLRSLVE